MGGGPHRPGNRRDQLARHQRRPLADVHPTPEQPGQLRASNISRCFKGVHVMLKHATLALLLAVMPASVAVTGGYPTKPVTIVVPFAAGGPNDVLARLVSDHMSRTLTQPVLIENAVGAGGTVGSARVAKAEPDGHTLLSGNLGSLGAAFSLYKRIGYDPRDFASVGFLAGTPNFLIVRKAF